MPTISADALCAISKSLACCTARARSAATKGWATELHCGARLHIKRLRRVHRQEGVGGILNKFCRWTMTVRKVDTALSRHCHAD